MGVSGVSVCVCERERERERDDPWSHHFIAVGGVTPQGFVFIQKCINAIEERGMYKPFC